MWVTDLGNMKKLCRNTPFWHVITLGTCKCMYVWLPLLTWLQLCQLTCFFNITQGQRSEYTYTLKQTNWQHKQIPSAETTAYYEREKKEYLIRDVCFCLPTDRRRACFKHRRLGILANLRRFVDLEKDHMEMFGRYFTQFYSILFKQTPPK